MFKSLFGGKPSTVPPTKLPQQNTFVDVLVEGRAARSVSVEAISPKGIVTREALGSVGESAVLVYAAAAGRFRAQTKIVAVTSGSTHFELPKSVSLVGAAVGEQQRATVRMDTLVMGGWRIASGGVGVGDFAKASIRDISRGGCSLITDRAIRMGGKVEVQLPLRAGAKPLHVMAEVLRHEQIERSGKQSHGLRFVGLRPEDDQAIVDFINRKQAELRSRGLA